MSQLLQCCYIIEVPTFSKKTSNFFLFQFYFLSLQGSILQNATRKRRLMKQRHRKKGKNRTTRMTIADNDIIAEMRRQPEQGFRLLMRKYREPVYWHIRRLVVTHADAQDAAQETFVRIFKSMDSYRGNTSFAAWIYRIATNEALRLISKRHDNVDMEREGTNLFDQMPADNYINIADTEAVNMQRAILALPPKQQVVFNMRFYDEMEYGDIAAATDSSVAAVKMNYHLAKEKVKKAIIN